jgi:hypothetical protein
MIGTEIAETEIVQTETVLERLCLSDAVMKKLMTLTRNVAGTDAPIPKTGKKRESKRRRWRKRWLE